MDRHPIIPAFPRNPIRRAATALALALAASASAAAAPADWCNALAQRLPGISKTDCQNSALMPTGVKSRRGFPILAREIATPPGKGLVRTTPRVLLIGGIHGDELTASAIVFKWMQRLEKPEAAGFHWKVAPIVNPDGLLAAKPQRVNANGVDLNRNFPTPGWHRDAPRYWAKATRSDPRRFPGRDPLSEPESRWVNDEIERFQPHLIISVHAPFGVLDFDGPAQAPRRFGQLLFKPVGVYPGSLGNYSGLYKNIPVITIELPHARNMPPEAEVNRIWQDMLAWMRGNVPQQAAVAGARQPAS
ncbi:MAG TPA: M14 family zinc carboxypeptidase [Rhodocyclaceae bacterium]|nr:M14 family zinc carboxypeptidase [Rhodocyclaceae bacterium]